MAFILTLVISVVAVLIWRPWGKATLFDGEVKVTFERWESAMGGIGKHVVLDFNRAGSYRITVIGTTPSPDEPFKEICEYDIEKYEIRTHRTVDVEPFKTTGVNVTVEVIEADGSVRTETCKLYAF